jgi:hypothetical protein
VGDRLVLASTDFNMLQAEERTIQGIRTVREAGQNYLVIELDQPLKYMHFGQVFLFLLCFVVLLGLALVCPTRICTE